MRERGDMTAEVPALSRQDEIGAMAKAVQVFKQNAAEMDRLRTEQEEQKQRAEENCSKWSHGIFRLTVR